MSNFRETRACIAYAYGGNFINEKEFVLLYDCHKSTNPEISYWNYDRFDLDEKSNATNARPSFVSTGRTFINLLNNYSYLTR